MSRERGRLCACYHISASYVTWFRLAAASVGASAFQRARFHIAGELLGGKDAEFCEVLLEAGTSCCRMFNAHTHSEPISFAEFIFERARRSDRNGVRGSRKSIAAILNRCMHAGAGSFALHFRSHRLVSVPHAPHFGSVFWRMPTQNKSHTHTHTHPMESSGCRVSCFLFFYFTRSLLSTLDYKINANTNKYIYIYMKIIFA